WALVGTSAPAGVRYGAVYVPGAHTPVLVAVGPSGSGYSLDDGATWTLISDVGYNTVSFAAPNAGWAAGTEGRIARWRGVFGEERRAGGGAGARIREPAHAATSARQCTG